MSSKKTPKRKQPESAASDDEHLSASKTPNRGLAMFESAVQEHCPLAKHSGGSVHCSVEGVVLRGSKIKVGTADKWQVDVAVDKVNASGCKDVVTSGVDGVAFSLPVKFLEASPDEKAKNRHAKGPSVIDVSDGNSRANFLGLVSTSFYMEEKKVATGGSCMPAVEECTPGTKVLITGAHSTYGRNGVDGRLFFNANKMVPVTSCVGTWDAASAIIKEARSHKAQASAAFLWSMAMNGFFGLVYNEPCLQQQADACKAKWEQLVSGSAAKCETIALSLGGDEHSASLTEALNANAARIKNITPEDAAKGAPIFHCDVPNECVTPYYAPIVQYNIDVSQKIPDFGKSLFDPAMRDSIPSAFVEGQVKQIEFKGNLVQVDWRLFWVFNKDAAIAAAEDEKNPVLHSTNSVCSVKFSKRSLGPELVGSLEDNKVEVAVREVFPVANQAVYALVFPRGADDIQLSGHFASTAGVDFADGIRKVGIQVSEQWLEKHMLDNTSVFIHEKNEMKPLIEPSDKAGLGPTLKTAGYQALSEGSFSMKSLKVPVAGKSKAYYVVYSGCSTNVGLTPALSTSAEAGEAHMHDIAASAGEEGDVKDFLLKEALVYVVMAP